MLEYINSGCLPSKIEFVRHGKGSGLYTRSKPMRPVVETSQLRCYTAPSSYHSNRYDAMPSRVSEVAKGDRFEGKGFLLLLICGFYAIVLFIMARLASYAVSKITTSVKSVFLRMDVTEATLMTKDLADDNNNDDSKQKRLQIRSTTHG